MSWCNGWTFLPYFQGKQKAGPRESIYYFDQSGNLNAIRFSDWKDPYERGLEQGGEAMKFFAQQMWLLVPIQQKIKEFFSDFEQYPHQEGSSLNAGNIGYATLRQAEAMKRLKELESLHPAA